MYWAKSVSWRLCGTQTSSNTSTRSWTTYVTPCCKLELCLRAAHRVCLLREATPAGFPYRSPAVALRPSLLELATCGVGTPLIGPIASALVHLGCFAPALLCAWQRAMEICLVMEYADSGDLAALIEQHVRRRRPIPEDTIWTYFIQVRARCRVHGLSLTVDHLPVLVWHLLQRR